MTLPGMRERVVRVGSAGKMFSLTGWKIGWVTGAAPLIDVIAKAHQFITFTTSPALQLGIAHALEHEIDFTLGLTEELQSKRDLLEHGLSKLGFDGARLRGHLFSHGGHSRPHQRARSRVLRTARARGRRRAHSAQCFFEDGKPDHLVRFAFCKKRAVIEDALARLERFFTKRQDAS
jgi:N-succinyldiaminopimelate aminotransferase